MRLSPNAVRIKYAIVFVAAYNGRNVSIKWNVVNCGVSPVLPRVFRVHIECPQSDIATLSDPNLSAMKTTIRVVKLTNGANYNVQIILEVNAKGKLLAPGIGLPPCPPKVCV